MATILFDLDGTLIDTASLVLPVFREVLRHVQASVPADDVLLGTFGMPDQTIWNLLLPTGSDSQREEAKRLSDSFIRERMQDTDVLLPHATEVLAALKDTGHTLTTASNCGIDYLDAALDTQGIRPYFTHPLCLGSVQGKRKADILTAHFRRFSKAGAVMVGDRHTDIEAAQEHGIPAVGCAFGFGDPDELAGAVAVIRALPELLPLFAGEALRFPE